MAYDILYIWQTCELNDAAILHTCDGAFQRFCDAEESHAMCYDEICNAFNILLPILEYLSYLFSDYQMILTKWWAFNGLPCDMRPCDTEFSVEYF